MCNMMMNGSRHMIQEQLPIMGPQLVAAKKKKIFRRSPNNYDTFDKRYEQMLQNRFEIVIFQSKLNIKVAQEMIGTAHDIPRHYIPASLNQDTGWRKNNFASYCQSFEKINHEIVFKNHENLKQMISWNCVRR